MQPEQQGKRDSTAAQESGNAILEEQMSLPEEQIICITNWKCIYSVWNWIPCRNTLHIFLQVTSASLLYGFYY